MSGEEVKINHGIPEINSVTELNKSMNSGLNRYAMFQILVENAIERISSSVSGDSYIQLFGGLTALKKSKSAPLKMHKTMKAKLVESLNSEIKQMAKEEQMEEKFNKLENLVDECAFYEGSETWRPNGNVNDHVRAHAIERKLKHKCALEEYVRDKEQSTEMLKQQVSELRFQVVEAEAELKQLRDLSLDTSVLKKISNKVTAKVSCL